MVNKTDITNLTAKEIKENNDRCNLIKRLYSMKRIDNNIPYEDWVLYHEAAYEIEKLVLELNKQFRLSEQAISSLLREITFHKNKLEAHGIK